MDKHFIQSQGAPNFASFEADKAKMYLGQEAKVNSQTGGKHGKFLAMAKNRNKENCKNPRSFMRIFPQLSIFFACCVLCSCEEAFEMYAYKPPKSVKESPPIDFELDYDTLSNNLMQKDIHSLHMMAYEVLTQPRARAVRKVLCHDFDWAGFRPVSLPIQHGGDVELAYGEDGFLQSVAFLERTLVFPYTRKKIEYQIYEYDAQYRVLLLSIFLKAEQERRRGESEPSVAIFQDKQYGISFYYQGASGFVYYPNFISMRTKDGVCCLGDPQRSIGFLYPNLAVKHRYQIHYYANLVKSQISSYKKYVYEKGANYPVYVAAERFETVASRQKALVCRLSMPLKRLISYSHYLVSKYGRRNPIFGIDVVRRSRHFFNYYGENDYIEERY